MVHFSHPPRMIRTGPTMTASKHEGKLAWPREAHRPASRQRLYIVCPRFAERLRNGLDRGESRCPCSFFAEPSTRRAKGHRSARAGSAGNASRRIPIRMSVTRTRNAPPARRRPEAEDSALASPHVSRCSGKPVITFRQEAGTICACGRPKYPIAGNGDCNTA